MAKSLVAKRGIVDPSDVDVFLKSGFTTTHLLALILAVGIKTMSNYTNHIVNTPLDKAFADHAWNKERR